MVIDEIFSGADERRKLEIDRLSARVMEFTLYRYYCECLGLKKNSVDSLNSFIDFARAHDYKFIGED